MSISATLSEVGVQASTICNIFRMMWIHQGVCCCMNAPSAHSSVCFSPALYLHTSLKILFQSQISGDAAAGLQIEKGHLSWNHCLVNLLMSAVWCMWCARASLCWLKFVWPAAFSPAAASASFGDKIQHMVKKIDQKIFADRAEWGNAMHAVPTQCPRSAHAVQSFVCR